VARWIGADEASRRLGVKPATLYAYVSRGVLARRKGDDGRSVFDAEEIERLALRGRPRRRAGSASEVVIESAVTLLGPDRAYYRGRDAIHLAATLPFESVATWLWTGDPTSLPTPPPAAAEPVGRDAADPEGAGSALSGFDDAWVADAAAVAAARAAQAGLPSDVLPLERLQVITTTLAAADPVRLTLDPAAVIRTGQTLIAGLVEALPPAAGAVPAGAASAGHPAAGAVPAGAVSAGYSLAGTVSAGRSVAGRLWARFAGPDADPALADVLRFAMVLLADHELAASTLAVRVAASVRADPYAVVAAGLGVTSGALHGGASLGVEAMLAEAAAPALAATVMGQRLRRGERIPGFGHAVYRSGDARATALLDRIRAALPATPGRRRHPALPVADAILAEATRRHLPPVNVDFALGLFTTVSGMPRGAGEAIFAIARTAGWLAHAMEEYAHPTKLRLRASYTGPLA
jgi:citrate synthase